MRISDWSSDVALPILQAAHEKRAGFVRRQREDRVGGLERFTKMAGLQPELRHRLQRLDIGRIERYGVAIRIIGPRNRVRRHLDPASSEERRVGKECVSKWRSRWLPSH